MKQSKITVTLATALAQQAYEQLREQDNKSQKELENAIKKDPLVIQWRRNQKAQANISSANRRIQQALSNKFKKEIYIYEKDLTVRGKSKLPSVSEIKTELLMLNHIDGIDAKQLVSKFLERK